MSELEQLRKEVNELRERVCNERDTYKVAVLQDGQKSFQ